MAHQQIRTNTLARELEQDEWKNWELGLSEKKLSDQNQASLALGIQEHQEMKEAGKNNVMSVDEIMEDIQGGV